MHLYEHFHQKDVQKCSFEVHILLMKTIVVFLSESIQIEIASSQTIFKIVIAYR